MNTTQLSRCIWFRCICPAAALLLALFCAVPTGAQVTPIFSDPLMSGEPPAFGNLIPGGGSAFAAKPDGDPNVARQKQIAKDTARLLELAKQLKAAVARSSKDELSLDVVNKAAEIQKLARQVEQEMSDGASAPAH